MLRQPLTITMLSIGGAAALMAGIALAALLLTNLGMAVNLRSVQFVLAILAIAMLVAVRFAIHECAQHRRPGVGSRKTSTRSARSHTTAP